MNLYKEFREMDTASPVAIEGITLEMLAEASRSRKSDCGSPATPLVETSTRSSARALF